MPRLCRIVPRELGLGRCTRRGERRWLVRQIEGQPGIESAFMAEPRRTLATYRRILDFVEARDARGARKMTRRLLDRLDERVLEVLGELAERAEQLRREARRRERASGPLDDAAPRQPRGPAAGAWRADDRADDGADDGADDRADDGAAGDDGTAGDGRGENDR